MPPPLQVIYQFHRIGSVIKVTAMDAATLTEVSIQGSVSHSKEHLQSVAKAKLVYMLAKKSEKK